jgi:hypothetical protein
MLHFNFFFSKNVNEIEPFSSLSPRAKNPGLAQDGADKSGLGRKRRLMKRIAGRLGCGWVFAGVAGKMRKRVFKPSSVSPGPERVIIPLARALLPGSSDLPGSIERATLKRSPIWSCSGWGLPCRPCHQGRGELLPRLFTLTR